MLDRLGVVREAYDAIISSGDVTREMIAPYRGRVIHHVGPPTIDDSLYEGLGVIRGPAEEAEAVVITDLDDDDDTPDMYRERIAALAPPRPAADLRQSRSRRRARRPADLLRRRGRRPLRGRGRQGADGRQALQADLRGGPAPRRGGRRPRHRPQHASSPSATASAPTPSAPPASASTCSSSPARSTPASSTPSANPTPPRSAPSSQPTRANLAGFMPTPCMVTYDPSRPRRSAARAQARRPRHRQFRRLAPRPPARLRRAEGARRRARRPGGGDDLRAASARRLRARSR